MTLAKVLVVGWDGATFDLLDPWMQAGELSNLSGLIGEGSRGALRSVPNMNSGPAWTTVATGVNPGKHGVYGLVGFAPESYRLRPLSGRDRRATPIWERLSAAGKRVAVVNLPITYPAEPLNGVLIAGGDAPSSHSPDFTYPPGLIGEIESRSGEYILAARLDGLIRAGKRGKALGRLHSMIESRTKACLHLMEKGPWDLFMVLFTASDSVQHFFWEDLAGGANRDAILEVYRHLDRSLGALCTAAGPGTIRLVLSDHGFGPTPQGPLYLNSFLEALGLLRVSAAPVTPRAIMRAIFLQLEARLGNRAKEILLERFPRLHETGMAGLWVQDIDWSGTKAFSVAGSSHIWINVRGRQAQGAVSDGAEREKVIDLIERALSEAVDAGTDLPVVRAVHRREEIYSGPYVGDAPDLLVEWLDRREVSGLVWREGGRLVAATERSAFRRHPINGSHRPLGILAAAGGPIRQGGQPRDASLGDIAPTLLHILGEPVPAAFDGRVLTDLLDPTWLVGHSPRIAGEGGPEATEMSSTMSRSDEDAVLDRLRGLGYAP